MTMTDMVKFITATSLLISLITTPAWSREPALPDYLENANTMVANASTAASGLQELADDILIAKNTIRNANSEYSKNLGSFTGKLDEKAEPVIRQLAGMATLQASLIIARAGTKKQEKELTMVESLTKETQSKIKVFDDLVINIKSLNRSNADQATRINVLEAKAASLAAELAAKGSAITSSDQKTADLLKALDEQKKATSSSEKLVAALTQELEGLKQQKSQLLASEQKLSAEKRIKSFEAEAGKLGGIVKATSVGLSVTFPRSQFLKTTGKSTTITAEGDKNIGRITDIVKTYPEYRIKLRVHGFGQPARNEDASATDQMARFLREAIQTRGKLDPASVEALGVGSAEPAFPKNNIEGNRRVEIIFVKK